MRLIAIALVALVAASGPCGADVVSERADRVTVTLYGGGNTDELFDEADAGWLRTTGLAFITEERTVELPAGPAVVRFRNVASTMVPQSADITGFPSGIVERNFDYDLLSPGSLLEKSIGRTVHLVRTDPVTGKRTETATVLRTGPEGAVLDIDGRIEALHCSGLPERLVFDALPEGLTENPTLSIRTVAPAPGRYAIRLRYLATGLTWTADYVARVAADGSSLDLSGWITTANFGDTSFTDVPVEAIAGALNFADDYEADQPVLFHAKAVTTACWPTSIVWATWLNRFRSVDLQSVAVATSNSPIQTVVVTAEKREGDPEQLGDYKLYRLPEKTSMAAHQIKQVQFLAREAVRFEKLYSFALDIYAGNGEQDEAADVIYRLHNKSEYGLGKPLPRGTIAIVEPGTAGEPVFVGSGKIRDTPIGLPLEVGTGKAMDVEVRYRVTKDEPAGGGDRKRRRLTLEAVVTNAKPVAIAFELYGAWFGDGSRILSETMPHTIARNAAMWPFSLKPGESVTLEYTVETED